MSCQNDQLLSCHFLAQPPAFTTRSEEAGYLSLRWMGRIGLGEKFPPQFGQMPASTSLAHSEQKVHSKVQMTASASGGKSLSQHSQFGRSSSISKVLVFASEGTVLIAKHHRQQMRGDRLESFVRSPHVTIRACDTTQPPFPNTRCRSAASSRRHSPSVSPSSANPPTALRCSATTWLPTAPNIRRTWW